MTAGLGPVPAAGRGFQRFFRRWGSKANIRAVFNSVQPVAVVDTYHGDEEGSYQAITAFVVSDIAHPNEFPAILIGSTDENVDLLIHKLAIWITLSPTGTPGQVPVQHDVFLYTPIGGYDPVLNLSPVGFYDSGLITPPNFTRGATVALAGWNPLLPPGPSGLTYSKGVHNTVYQRGQFMPPSSEAGNAGTIPPSDKRDDWMDFDPPLRLPDGISLACQWENSAAAGNILLMWATFLFTERRMSS